MGITFAVSLMSGVIDSSMLVTSATSGPLLGVFLLAMLVPCANWKGAAVGMVVSHVLTLWVAFGGLTVPDGARTQYNALPVSTFGCANDTFAQHLHTSNDNNVFFWQVQPIPIAGTDLVMNSVQEPSPDRDFLTTLYSITYMYYCMFGCLMTVALGTIVSYFTTITDEELYGEHLLHPVVLRWSRLLPGAPRRYSLGTGSSATPAVAPHTKPAPIAVIQVTAAHHKSNGHMDGVFRFKNGYL